MKKIKLALMLCLSGLGLVGCRHPDPPPPPPGGVAVRFPGGGVNVNDYGTAVRAPGVDVRAP